MMLTTSAHVEAWEKLLAVPRCPLLPSLQPLSGILFTYPISICGKPGKYAWTDPLHEIFTHAVHSELFLLALFYRVAKRSWEGARALR